MRAKINKLILNNINKNKQELNEIVWRWLSHKTQNLKKKLSLNKDDDLYITMALAKSKQKTKRNYVLRGQRVKAPMYMRKFRRICLVTGRTRGVSRYFSLSRIQIKRAAKLRLVSGLRKSSW